MPTLDPPVDLIEIDLPDFGEPDLEPSVPKEVYAARVETALARAKTAGLDALVVYGDREHMANVTYLTGYDPRFEETLLILIPGAVPALLVGNEGWGYTEIAPGTFERVLFQSFSLLDQPRGACPPLDTILRERGLTEGQRIGTVGWKCFDETDGGLDANALEIPSYIADLLRAIAGPTGGVTNVTGMFMSSKDGLRTINEVEQLAVFEHAATFASQAVRNLVFGLRVGMTEFEAARLMGMTGMPLSTHTMLSTGERAFYGLPSPSSRKIALGDPLSTAHSAWGALTARAGFVVHESDELPEAARAYVPDLVAPYFSAAAAWYETIGIGVTGGTLYEAVMSRIGAPFFGVGLNPGHFIHLDEWVSSSVFKGSTIPFRSGMAVQIDVIPATHSPLYTSNIEDGIALADESLRAEFAARYPEAWSRITRRRRFMIETLGIRLKPEVLPFSNMPAYLPPYLLSPGRGMAVRR